MTSRWTVCCSIVVGAALALPAGVGAAPAGSGTSVLRLEGAAARALSAQGVKVGAVAPAKAAGTRLTLPVATASVGVGATLGYGGGVRLKAGKRSVTLSALRLSLAKDSRLRARVGGRTVTVLTVAGARRDVDKARGTVALKGASVRLTAAGAAAVRRALHLRRLAPGTLGRLTVDARRGAAGGTTGGGTGAAPGSGTGSAPATGPGAPGTTTPSAPGTTAPANPGPPPLARPATAVDITAATITWHVRDSFIQYINAGEGTTVSAGATADPPSVQPGSSVPLTYAFHFPFTGGWYDPVSGAVRVTYAGTVTFGFRAHGIKLTAADPEIELAGGGSRAIFRTANAGETPSRGVLETLSPAAAAGTTHSPDGTAHAYTQIPGAIPADAGASVFAGFYAAGDPFGWITVELTTPPA
ncbi:MAG TPA: HtaA domain-containing protein [Baekduia sp.]|jgi:hypothetical protein